MFVHRTAWERGGLLRAQVDDVLGLTADEFRVEGTLLAIGPLYGDGQLESLITLLERAGLTYFEEFFDLSGNWPAWLTLHAQGE